MTAFEDSTCLTTSPAYDKTITFKIYFLAQRSASEKQNRKCENGDFI
jgi:hypothetical protein